MRMIKSGIFVSMILIIFIFCFLLFKNNILEFYYEWKINSVKGEERLFALKKIKQIGTENSKKIIINELKEAIENDCQSEIEIIINIIKENFDKTWIRAIFKSMEKECEDVIKAYEKTKPHYRVIVSEMENQNNIIEGIIDLLIIFNNKAALEDAIRENLDQNYNQILCLKYLKRLKSDEVENHIEILNKIIEKNQYRINTTEAINLLARIKNKERITEIKKTLKQKIKQSDDYMILQAAILCFEKLEDNKKIKDEIIKEFIEKFSNKDGSEDIIDYAKGYLGK